MGSEQAREAAKAEMSKHGLEWIGGWLGHEGGALGYRANVPALGDAVLEAMLSFATTAREQALREAAEIAQAHCQAECEEGIRLVKSGNEFARLKSSGKQAAAIAIQSSILSLLTKEPKA